MAHFLGKVKGARSEVSRLGHKGTGLETTAASWQGAVKVTLHHCETDGEDWATIRLIPWHGSGIEKCVYNGPVGGDNGK